jgi:hypothetical protein
MKDQTTATATATQREETTARLNELMNSRNALIKALSTTNLVKPMFEKIVHELCETIAQISVYKTLLKLSDSPTNQIYVGAQEKCMEMYKSFTFDMITYRHNDTTQTYSDAMDLFNIAYMEVWQYLHTSAPLTLDDTVETKVLKNGTEKNYTIFQTACKSVREYIHGWSKTDQYKKLHYIVGIADNGEMVTTSKRPADSLTDIDETTKTAFFKKYGLTAQEQEIISLLIRGEDMPTIAKLLNIPTVTAYKQTAKAKAKFATAQAYAEYITAQNAEKLAKAKAEKHPTDSVYQITYTKAQERTATAYKAWKTAFYAEKKNKA